MEKKYELTDETINVRRKGVIITLYRIRALKNFGEVEAGDLGGFIEKESNLSHEGNCWNYGGKIYGNAKVYGDARINYCAIVADCAEVYERANVSGKVYDNAKVYGKAHIYQNARIYENAKVYGDAEIDNNVCGNTEISGNSNASDDEDKEPDNKYELTDETRLFCNVKFYRIRATRDFETLGGMVYRGELGGYVENNSILSQEGNCWVDQHCFINGDLTISGDTYIGDNVHIDATGEISGNTNIRNSLIMGIVHINGGDDTCIVDSTIKGDVHIDGDSLITDSRIDGTVNITKSNILKSDISNDLDINDDMILSNVSRKTRKTIA